MTGRTAPIRRTAHDSGDGMTIAHCFSCGGGQIVGRSDGTAECEFCGIAFTVQVQPMFSGFPQTVDGQPFPIPGMPGQIGGPPAAPGAMDPGMDPGMDGDPDGGNPFADDADPAGQDGPGGDEAAGGNPFADDSGGASPDGPPPPKAKPVKPKAKKASSLDQSPRYATARGEYLSPDAFSRYLAIRHAFNDELDPLLERLRNASA